MENMMQYQALMRAVAILRVARLEVWEEDGSSPAWSKLCRVYDYLRKQGEALLEVEA